MRASASSGERPGATSLDHVLLHLAIDWRVAHVMAGHSAFARRRADRQVNAAGLDLSIRTWRTLAGGSHLSQIGLDRSHFVSKRGEVRLELSCRGRRRDAARGVRPRRHSAGIRSANVRLAIPGLLVPAGTVAGAGSLPALSLPATMSRVAVSVTSHLTPPCPLAPLCALPAPGSRIRRGTPRPDEPVRA